jgi:hypothetical protein
MGLVVALFIQSLRLLPLEVVMVRQLVRQPDCAVLFVFCGLWGCSRCSGRVVLCTLCSARFHVYACTSCTSRLGNRG